MTLSRIKNIFLVLAGICVIGTLTVLPMFPKMKYKTTELTETFKSVKFINSLHKVKEKFSLDQEEQQIPLWQIEFNKQVKSPVVAGSIGAAKKFLAIGISTVYRKENYLQKTIQSLVNQSSPAERSEAVIVIFLADIEPENKKAQLQMIQEEFSCYLESGFIHIISSGPEIYPPMVFAIRRRTYNDSADRVLWRTKQVVDFAFLLSYAENLSTYYLVLEDDVISAPQYVTTIKEFIFSNNRQLNNWAALHCTQFEGIGLIFHNIDISELTNFLIMFHQAHPVDILMRKFIELQAPGETLPRLVPSVFQHIGIKSTLPHKIQNLMDSTFGKSPIKIEHNNNRSTVVVLVRQAIKTTAAGARTKYLTKFN